MNAGEKLTINFLKKIGINVNTIQEIDGITITRDGLLDKEKYESVKELIPELKKSFSSSFLTSLQKTATTSQKWPLLNLLRQILNQNQFNMMPIRKSDGRDKNGKKRYKRYFIIKKKVIVKNQLKNVDLTDVSQAVEEAETETKTEIENAKVDEIQEAAPHLTL